MTSGASPSIQEQLLQKKRIPIDVWDSKEKLLLATAVVKIGDQNWMSVSRYMKSNGLPSRPPDWYSQRNCAAQYGLLMEGTETPKRKKRTPNSTDDAPETVSEFILRRCRDERVAEISKKLMYHKSEYEFYQKRKEDCENNRFTLDQLKEICKQIEVENKQKELETNRYAEFLKEREEKIKEWERQWRPKLNMGNVGMKRKSENTLENILSIPEQKIEHEESDSKPAVSPLLTSLLKSPSPVASGTNTLLHNAITNSGVVRNTNASPTIASLLNTSTEVNVSAGLQQLVSSAIGQQDNKLTNQLSNSIFDGNLLVGQLGQENIMVPNILTDKQNINPNMLTDHLEEDLQLIEEVIKEDVEKKNNQENFVNTRDLNDNSAVDDTKIGEIKNELDKVTAPLQAAVLSKVNQLPLQIQPPTIIISQENKIKPESQVALFNNETQAALEINSKESIILKNDENQLTKNENFNLDSQVEENKQADDGVKETEKENSKNENIENESSKNIKKEILETIKEEIIENDDIEKTEISESKENTLDSEKFDSDDDIAIAVIKSEAIKRDYSRKSKKDEEGEDIDIIIPSDEKELDDEKPTQVELDKIDEKIRQKDSSLADVKVKTEQRCDSPLTEGEESSTKRRRYSNTLTDSSIPSPASSTTDDDKDYRAWKKSIMLLYNTLTNHRCSTIFHKPINEEQVPGYHSRVKQPKSFYSLRKLIENGQIRTTPEFIRYILIMVQNAIMFNKEKELIYERAKEMQIEYIKEIDQYVKAQAEADQPLRRETRNTDSLSNKKSESTTKTRRLRI